MIYFNIFSPVNASLSLESMFWEDVCPCAVSTGANKRTEIYVSVFCLTCYVRINFNFFLQFFCLLHVFDSFFFLQSSCFQTFSTECFLNFEIRCILSCSSQFDNEKEGLVCSFLSYKCSKLKLRAFSRVTPAIAIVTYCAMKLTPTCSPMIGLFFDNMTAPSTDLEWLQ